MNRKTLIVASAVAAVVLIAGGLFAVMRDGDHGPGHDQGHMVGTLMGSGPEWDGPMMEAGRMPGLRSMGSGGMAMDEKAFLAMMIPHHQMAVDMAEIEVARGTDAEVLAMAKTVMADQRAEIAQMTRWYREWFGAEPPAIRMTGAIAMMGMSMDMAELDTTDEPDRVFLRMMQPHHAGALLMADLALAGSPRDEVATLAREIVATQSAEIGEMQRMRVRIAPPVG